MGKVQFSKIRTIEAVETAFKKQFGQVFGSNDVDTLKRWIAYTVTHTDINVDVVEAVLQIAKQVIGEGAEVFTKRQMQDTIMILNDISNDELQDFNEKFTQAVARQPESQNADPEVKWMINLITKPLHEIYEWAVKILKSGEKGKVKLIDCNFDDEILDARDFAYEIDSGLGCLFIELSHKLATSWSNAKYYYECNYITEYGDIFELKDALRMLWSSNIGISGECLMDTPYDEAVDWYKFAEILFEEQPDINVIDIGDRTYIFWNE